MVGRWTIVVLLTLLESINTNKDISDEKVDMKDMKEYPFAKSLGYAIRKNFGKKLDEARLNQEFMYQYQEVIKASQELSFESFEDQADRKMRGVDKGESDRRRHSAKLQSAAGVRRSRSQALRLQKLNSQSLKSHQKHLQQNKNTVDE